MTAEPDSPGAGGPARRRDRAAWVALVGANLVPLALVLAGLWDIAGVMLLYWAENLVIGGYNLARIALAGRGSPGEKAGLSAFFAIHYGGFCLGHGLVIAGLFDLGAKLPPPALGEDRLEELAPLFGAFDRELAIALLALTVSHGVSFVRHYWIGGERLAAKASEQMWRPYGRIVVMHLAVLGGGLLVQNLGAPIGALIVLIVLKTVVDLAMHRRSHERTDRA